MTDDGVCRSCEPENPADRPSKPVIDFSDDAAVRRYNEQHPLVMGVETMMKYVAMKESHN